MCRIELFQCLYLQLTLYKVQPFWLSVWNHVYFVIPQILNLTGKCAIKAATNLGLQLLARENQLGREWEILNKHWHCTLMISKPTLKFQWMVGTWFHMTQPVYRYVTTLYFWDVFDVMMDNRPENPTRHSLQLLGNFTLCVDKWNINVSSSSANYNKHKNAVINGICIKLHISCKTHSNDCLFISFNGQNSLTD